MMANSKVRVGIVHGRNAFLPEIRAYRDYLEDNGWISVRTYHDLRSASRECDIAIIMMGFVPFWHGRPRYGVIAEYHSLSTGRFRRIKDLMKRVLGVRGRWYIALNEQVARRLFLPMRRTILRPMGVPVELVRRYQGPERREFSAIYAGSLNRPGVINHLQRLANTGLRIHVYGNRPEDALALESSVDQIICHGVVSQEVVAEAMVRAEFGINYTPNRRPWNIQDSTKVLEYCAAGLKVITNRYQWVDAFEKQYQARFMDICDATDLHSIRQFPFVTPDVRDLEWPRVLERAGILRVIEEISNAGRSSVGSPSPF